MEVEWNVLFVPETARKRWHLLAYTGDFDCCSSGAMRRVYVSLTGSLEAAGAPAFINRNTFQNTGNPLFSLLFSQNKD